MQTSDGPKICTLLHFADREANAVNVSTNARAELYQILAGNLIALNSSLALAGYQLTVVTNDVLRLRRLLARHVSEKLPAMVPGDFAIQPPADIRFYSAHFKLDVFKMFGRKPDQVFMLLDTDMLLLRKLPMWLTDLAQKGAIISYDITSQVTESVGAKKILTDLNILNSEIESPQWFGGEFICAQGRRFAQISEEVDKIWPIYCSRYSEMHHQGDEMVVTAALHALIRLGVEVRDAGSAGLIRRFWSVRTRHNQPALSDSAELCFLHLPADKKFLAQIGETDLTNNAKRFWRLYAIYWRYRRALSNLKAMLTGWRHK